MTGKPHALVLIVANEAFFEILLKYGKIMLAAEIGGSHLQDLVYRNAQ